ncbi:uncharacterized protein TNCV_2109351 [Trichonephila clavipes]|nr:uncharacterized protein TNCV_2109351 [Trichonephila clavipes]
MKRKKNFQILPKELHQLKYQFSSPLQNDTRKKKFNLLFVDHQRCHEFESSTTKDPSCMATRGLLATDHVILNHGQVTWTTPELTSPLLTTTPHQREDVSALDRFNVHRCPTRRVFSGTGLEPVTKQATV